MKFVPQNSTDATQESLDRLREQHEDLVLSYASKITELKNQINVLELNKRNIETYINDAVQQERAKLAELTNQVLDKITEAKKREQIAESLANNYNELIERQKESQKLLEDLHQTHADKVLAHRDSVESVLKEVDTRNSRSLQLQEAANLTALDASERLAKAIKQEQRIEEEAKKLVHIQANIEADVAIQKDLYAKNKVLLDDLEKKNVDATNLLNNAKHLKEQADQIRLECDVATERLAKRKNEIDEKFKSLKATEISQQLTDQRLDAKQKDIDDQTVKLNKLKTDVEELIKQKEAIKEA